MVSGILTALLAVTVYSAVRVHEHLKHTTREDTESKVRDGIKVFRQEGHDVYELRSGKSVMQVVPSIGSNMISMTQELRGKRIKVIEPPPSLRKLKEENACFYGNPVLFPFACRMEDEFSFDGERYRTPSVMKAGGYPMHGLVGRLPWKVVDTGENVKGTWIQTSFDFDDPELPAHWRDVYGGLKIALKFVLDNQGARVTVNMRNRGRDRRIMSFACHPIFPVHGRRSQARVFIDARTLVRLKNGLPEEVAQPEGNTIMQGRAVGEDYLCPCYTDLARDGQGNASIVIEYPDPGLRLRVLLGSKYRHLVFWMPPADLHKALKADEPIWGGNAVFAIEPHTSSINAPVLHSGAKGSELRRIANPIILDSGEEFEEFFSFGMETMPLLSNP